MPETTSAQIADMAQRWDEILCHELSQICRDAAYERRDATTEIRDHVARCMAEGGECHMDALRGQFPQDAGEA